MPSCSTAFRALPRVLHEQCAGDAAAGVTADPVADVGALAAPPASGPMRGRAFDRRGRSAHVTTPTPTRCSSCSSPGDLNPYLQAALPAALAAARRGDPSLLLRLRRDRRGRAHEALRELSFGLNVTTGCLDAAAALRAGRPRAERGAAGPGRRAAAVPPADYAPFDAAHAAAHHLRRRLPALAARRAEAGLHRPAARRAGAAARRSPGHPHPGRERAGARPRSCRARRSSRSAAPATTSSTATSPAASRVRSIASSGSARSGGPCARPHERGAAVPAPADARCATSARRPGWAARAGAPCSRCSTPPSTRASARCRRCSPAFRPAAAACAAGRYAAGDALGGDLRLRGYAYLGGLRVTGSIDDGNGASARHRPRRRPAGHERLPAPGRARRRQRPPRRAPRALSRRRLGGRARRGHGGVVAAGRRAVAAAPAGPGPGGPLCARAEPQSRAGGPADRPAAPGPPRPRAGSRGARV